MGRRRIEIKKIPSESARRTTFNKRKQGLFKKAYELSVLTGCDLTVTVTNEQGVTSVFDAADLSSFMGTAKAPESRGKSQDSTLPAEVSLPTAIMLPEASLSPPAVLELSEGSKPGTPVFQSVESPSRDVNGGTMELIPVTDFTGMQTWDGTLVNDCMFVGDSLPSMFVPPPALDSNFSDPYGLSLYPSFPYFTNEFGWFTESPLQMPLLF
ncbi:MADS-box transcription factor pvg4 [Fusarium mundagurra]|uniref:MADS-box transcription factor pvg4 n=1 Tax=Fusarium mundagurra TaxID=1567541 RepID=A0A8H6DRT4_9HYPO|nr:MADS-box transcription factor pvg4 [Fusarium mundagurra]